MQILSLFVLTMGLMRTDAQLRAAQQSKVEIEDVNTTNAVLSAATSDHRQLKSIDFVGNDGIFDVFPLKECMGDCDGDNDCDQGLVCFQRTARTAVPGCSGGERDTSESDYCVKDGSNADGKQKPASVHLRAIGNNGRPSWAFPLGLCQGDCDSDRDCNNGLKCFQRTEYEDVPGCQGGKEDDSVIDYCVLTDSDTSTRDVNDGNSPSGSVIQNKRLKLYWEKGYFWQEETRERKWCIMHHYDGLPGDGGCWYGRERKDCRDDQLYISKCSGDSRQKFDILKLSGGEFQIRLGDENLCFERKKREIYLRGCNSGKATQRWYAPNGSIDGKRFEISQKDYSSQCLTQDHHPKHGEVIETHFCESVRTGHDETSYWNLY